MKVYQVEDLTLGLKTPMVVCLGVFDGVHLGHQSLIKTALQLAKEDGLEAMVHTYDPEPFCVLHPEECQRELTNLEERLSLFEQYGINQVAVSRFTETMQQESGAKFFQDILVDKLNAKSIVVGFNHRFGYKGDTDVTKLKALCDEKGIKLTVIDPVKTPTGKLISSTAIRTAIQEGDFALASLMMGRPMDESSMPIF